MFDRLFQSLSKSRSGTVVNRILPYINKSKKLIDIGSGTGDVARLLQQQGKNVTAVDVTDYHGPRLIKTIIYDGKKLPFPNKTFDIALLLMVMHHCPDPNIVFFEATRVAREIVVIETSYTSQLSKFFTVLIDTLGNLRLDANWLSYKSDEEWKEYFEKHGYRIVNTKKYADRNFGLPFLHIAYYLKKI